MITHRNYLISTAPAWGWGLRTGTDDVWLYVMPFHTIAGIGSMTSLLLMGATLVLPATVEAGGVAGDDPRRGHHGHRPDARPSTSGWPTTSRSDRRPSPPSSGA